MSTSGTYNAVSPKTVEIIQDAYYRAGLNSSALITAEQIVNAERSLNFILQSWINRGLNLWQVRQGVLQLNPNQNSYTLNVPVIDILEATIRTSQRNLGGTPFSSSGVAANAFDNNPNTACTETSPNGYIGYNWGSTQFATTMVGIQSNATLSYTLSFSYSFDGTNYFTFYNYPAQTYNLGQITWIVIPNTVAAPYFKMTETGGSTLNIQELYFSTVTSDVIVTRMSRAEYVAIANKLIQGGSRPTSFYVDRQIVPTLYLWPTPSSQFSNFYYTYISQLQDIGNMVQMGEIPSRFLEAICAKLAHYLALKMPNIQLDRVNMLKALADEEYQLAAMEDRERVPLRIYGDFSQGWTQT